VETAVNHATPPGVTVGEEAQEAEKETPTPTVHHEKPVTREEFAELKTVVDGLKETLTAVAETAPVAVEEAVDSTPRSTPWTHKRFGKGSN
jgi:hypothetical protein